MNPERLPTELYGAAETREIDARAVASGTPGIDLMRSAGLGAWRILQANYPECQRLRVFCGAGNNAGDGYEVARHAHIAGLNVQVIALVPLEALSGEASEAAAAAVDADVTIRRWADGAPDDSDVVVDALLGTGLSRDVDGDFAAAIAVINRSSAKVLSLDVPSGVDADTGGVRGTAVVADLTVSFIGLNAGLFTGPAVNHVGRVLFLPLEVDDTCRQSVQPVAMLQSCRATALSSRRRDSHKGTYGRLLLLGGNTGMAGAIRISAEGACRAGAGLVTVGTRSQHAAQVTSALPEAMTVSIENESDLQDAIERAGTVAVGPGLGHSDWSHLVWQSVLQSKQPAVVDADALTLWSADPTPRAATVVTPHPGEAATLLQTTTASVQNNRLESAQAIADRYGVVCVLKGAGTVVAGGDGRPSICSYGNPAMSSGGMGDLLTGVIGALLAQGVAPRRAADVGVLVHARAGDFAAKYTRHVIATDVSRWLGRALWELGKK